MTGAVTSTSPLESFEPPVRLRYDYFTDQHGSPRNVAEMPGEGPTWLGGYISLPDKHQTFRMGAAYSKIRPPMRVYECGLCVWNDETEVFEHLKTVWRSPDADSSGDGNNADSPPPMPHGHPVHWRDEHGDSWVLFGDPFPTLMCAATHEAWSDPKAWRELEPQRQVPTLRDPQVQVRPHRGAMAWNAYLGKWVAVFTQLHGDSSFIGEIWFAQADSPRGPWKDAVHVVSHRDYSFYNPQLHPEFTDEASPVLLFEATYTQTFSGAKVATPRYNYNQILYRLDLNEFRR
jgi:hypothetical protein